MLSLYKTDTATVYPCTKLAGTIEVPGDKSISHRVGMLASLSSGISHVTGFLNSADCVGLLKAMEALGARSHRSHMGDLYIHGTGGRLMPPANALDLGNSGTAIRLLTGLLAGTGLSVTLTGDESLCSRPMRRIEDPLRRMGARIELQGAKGCAPVHIEDGRLQGIEYVMPVASAQVKSCIMLATLFAEGTTRIIEPTPTRDHTERIFRTLNLPITVDGQSIQVTGFGAAGPKLKAREWAIPGDISSAAFWLVAGALTRGSITLRHVGLNPRRTAVLDVLKRMGAKIKITPAKHELGNEPVGDIKVSGGRLKGTVIGGTEIPNLIDEIPILAVAGALADGETVIKDARELRVKESDRIETMCDNLRRVGVEVEEMDDGMRIVGPAKIHATQTANSFGDHRIAMSMAVLALFSDNPLTIKRIDCIETSYPGFWDHLKRLGGHVE
jgi:3-phosphoshikimate 1-carboxyvinyltransferase